MGIVEIGVAFNDERLPLPEVGPLVTDSVANSGQIVPLVDLGALSNAAMTLFIIEIGGSGDIFRLSRRVFGP